MLRPGRRLGWVHQAGEAEPFQHARPDHDGGERAQRARRRLDGARPRAGSAARGTGPGFRRGVRSPLAARPLAVGRDHPDCHGGSGGVHGRRAVSVPLFARGPDVRASLRGAARARARAASGRARSGDPVRARGAPHRPRQPDRRDPQPGAPRGAFAGRDRGEPRRRGREGPPRAHSKEHLRKFGYHLAVNLMAWDATTFLLGEYGIAEIATNPLFSIVDGLIAVTHREQPGPGGNPADSATSPRGATARCAPPSRAAGCLSTRRARRSWQAAATRAGRGRGRGGSTRARGGGGRRGGRWSRPRGSRR